MRFRTCNTIGISAAIAFATCALTFALPLGGCSGSDGDPDDPVDANTGMGVDAGVDAAPEVDCAEMQRDYVNGVLAPEQQTDVTVTVEAVLRAADFPQAMPYCSGPRPSGGD